MMLTHAFFRSPYIQNTRYIPKKRAKYSLLSLVSVFSLLSAPVMAGCLAGQPKTCAATINGQGQVGLTSYTTLPFASSIYAQSWGSSPGLAPANLFWQQGSNFTNAQTMTAARQYAAKLTTKGIVPASGAQRWEDTYEAAQPASQFPGEPSWIAADRQSLGLVSKPEFQAWVKWQQAHSNLFMVVMYLRAS